MRRLKRRLWTLGITAAAVLLIVLAVIVGAFRLHVALAPESRQALVDRVGQELGRRIELKSVDLSWRNWHPSLDLGDVTLLGDDDKTPLLKLDGLSVSFELLRLLTGQLHLAEVRLLGPVITVERQADGSLRLGGLQPGEPLTAEDVRAITRWVERVGRLVVEDGEVLWVDVAQPKTFERITELSLLVSARREHREVHARARLPDRLGGEFQLTADIGGSLDTLTALKTEATLQAQNLRPGSWLEPWLAEGAVVGGDDARLALEGRWTGLQPETLRAQFSSGALWRGAGKERQPLWRDLNAVLALERRGEGWRISVSELGIEGAGERKSEANGYLDYLPPGAGRDLALSGTLSRLLLEDLGGWLEVLRLPAGLRGLAPSGRLDSLSFSYRRAAVADGDATPPASEFRAGARLVGVGIAPAGTRPGFSGLRGSLELNQDGGGLQLDVRDGSFLAPRLFDQPLPLQSLSGRLQWRRGAEGWQLESRDLKWQGPGDLRGDTRFNLQLPGGELSPLLDLDMRYSGSDMDAVRPFVPHVPKVLSEQVRHWIADSIKRASVTSGRLQIQGRLSDFPYHNSHEPGLFRVELNVADGQLAYAPGWPSIDEARVQVVFQGRSMLIRDGSGRILGEPVTGVQGDVHDFLRPTLEIGGDSAGDAGRMLRFLQESPLRKQYAALSSALKLQGPARLKLALAIPLDKLEATQVNGQVLLDGGVQLNHARLPEPVTALTGQVGFSNSGLQSQDLRGQLLGLQLGLQLTPETEGQQHLTRLKVSTELALPRDAEKLSRVLAPRWLEYLSGSSGWQAEMLFDAAASPSKLHLQSDLAGLESRLPPPLAKHADETRQVSVDLDPAGDEGMRADVSYGQVFDAALLLRQQQEKWALVRGTVRLGGGEAVLSPVGGIWLLGRLPELNLDEWRRLAAEARRAGTGQPAGQPAPGPELSGVDAEFDRLTLSGQQLEKIRLQLARQGADWQLTATGPQVEGVVRWPAAPAARRVYKAEFERLALKPQPPEPKKPDAPRAPATDPAQLPGVSLACKSLLLNGQSIGALQLEALPVPDGLRLGSLAVTGPNTQIQGDGEWTRSQGLSQGRLKARGSSRVIRDLFTALGYSPSLQADKARIDFDINWAPHADGLVAEAINGTLKVKMEQGSLLAVNPGAGRALGLLNFYALPRRFTLDFRDVVSEGFSFDDLGGDFRIEQGNAYTSNLKMSGPGAKMRIKGRVGLAARDYDQIVSMQFQSQLSSGVALAGTALGGPAVGAVLLIGQQLFKKPLEGVSEITYHLRGTWDNPDVDRVEDEP